MALLTLDQIINIDDLQKEVVEVPEWGGDVMIRGLTGQERDAWESSLVIGKGKKSKTDTRNFRARLVAACAINENGELLFVDYKALGEKSGSAINRLYKVAEKLSGLSIEEQQEIEEN